MQKKVIRIFSFSLIILEYRSGHGERTMILSLSLLNWSTEIKLLSPTTTSRTLMVTIRPAKTKGKFLRFKIFVISSII